MVFIFKNNFAWMEELSHWGRGTSYFCIVHEQNSNSKMKNV